VAKLKVSARVLRHVAANEAHENIDETGVFQRRRHEMIARRR
jgi:hypothetical protein